MHLVDLFIGPCLKFSFSLNFHWRGPTTLLVVFMKKDLIKHVVGRLSHLLRNGDCIVDLDCGKNKFVPLVKEVARKDGLVVTGRSYDVIVPKDLVNCVRKPWKAVTPESGKHIYWTYSQSTEHTRNLLTVAVVPVHN
jgi:hypothetical protein